jgi:hypothetical protein
MQPETLKVKGEAAFSRRGREEPEELEELQAQAD